MNSISASSTDGSAHEAFSLGDSWAPQDLPTLQTFRLLAISKVGPGWTVDSVAKVGAGCCADFVTCATGRGGPNLKLGPDDGTFWR